MISNTNSKYDVIVIDESQDFSNLWWTIIESLERGHNPMDLWGFKSKNMEKEKARYQ